MLLEVEERRHFSRRSEHRRRTSCARATSSTKGATAGWPSVMWNGQPVVCICILREKETEKGRETEGDDGLVGTPSFPPQRREHLPS